MKNQTTLSRVNQQSEEEIAARIVEVLKKIHYGAIEITIHDSKVVQIESREKVRL